MIIRKERKQLIILNFVEYSGLKDMRSGGGVCVLHYETLSLILKLISHWSHLIVYQALVGQI